MEALDAAVPTLELAPTALRDAVEPASRAQAVACRTLDVVVGAVLLVVLGPVLALVAVAIRLDTPGAALYRQRRIGLRGRSFTMNKFRTMVGDASPDPHRRYMLGLIHGVDASAPGGTRPMSKLAADPRVTRVGRLLRRSSVDELPQLWNVLRGEMSLVGPRPALAYEVEQYPTQWLERFSVKPGITGPWQVSGRSGLSFEDMIRLDVDYARRRSVWLNVKVLARTVWAVIEGGGAA